MAPQALPDGFGDANWKESSGFTSLVGLHEATIFTAKPKTSEKGKPGFELTFRIDGGAFDGEDVVERFAGITSDTIFRTHDILKAAGVLDNYYKRNADGNGGQWVGVPTKDELEGLKLMIAVQNQPWQGTDRETGQPSYNQDGTPRMLDSNVIARYYALGTEVDISTLPAQKPRYQPGEDGSGKGRQGGGFGGGNGFAAPQQQSQPQGGGSPWPAQQGQPQQQGQQQPSNGW